MRNISEINVHKLTDPIQTGYYNQAITAVNDHVIRVSVMTSGYPWHLHPNSDETFIVFEGSLVLETKDQVLNLEPGQIATVPANLVHRTSPARARSVNLTVERENTETILAEP
jgi:mannose-6-phosphate isomerase-like protein (cupin superfamily)